VKLFISTRVETIYGSVIAAFALFGFPTLSGYFSKDFLLESIFDAGAFLSIPTFILVSVASGLTAAYSVKSSYGHIIPMIQYCYKNIFRNICVSSSRVLFIILG